MPAHGNFPIIFSLRWMYLWCVVFGSFVAGLFSLFVSYSFGVPTEIVPGWITDTTSSNLCSRVATPGSPIASVFAPGSGPVFSPHADAYRRRRIGSQQAALKHRTFVPLADGLRIQPPRSIDHVPTGSRSTTLRNLGRLAHANQDMCDYSTRVLVTLSSAPNPHTPTSTNGFGG